jgi:diguanylate cyclase
MLDAARLYGQHVGSRFEQLRMIDALTDAATHDALTGIANRRAAQARLDELQPGDAVFMLDLDNFKSINDTLGHQTGDELLTLLGDYLRQATRPTDTVARYGGEEFILICSQTTPSDAERIAKRLLDGWRSRDPLATFSIGWSVHEGDAGVKRTMEQADAALYAAKCGGRNCSRSYAEVGSDGTGSSTASG